MKRQQQNGSAHAVIIIVLALGLLTALGWIFYQNFLGKDTGAVASYKECAQAADSKIQESYPEVCVTKDGQRFTNPEQKNPKKDEAQKLLTGSSNSVFPKTVKFAYPESWKLSSKMTNDKVHNYGTGESEKGDQEAIEVVSPSGEYTVKYFMYNPFSGDGVGGNETIAFSSYEVSSNLKDATFVAYSSKDHAGKYRGWAGLVREVRNGEYPTWSQRKVGDELGSTWSVLDVSGTQMAFTALISVKSIEAEYSSDYEGEDSPELFKKAYSGKEFEQAKAIMLSTKVE